MDEVKEFVAVIVLFIVCIGVLLGVVKLKANSNEKDFMTEISSYETISINGEDYKTGEVTMVTSHPGIYEEDAYEIVLKDGTKIYFSANGYTLKDKK
jgi:hypothetical protein